MSFRHEWPYFLYLSQAEQGDISNASPVQDLFLREEVITRNSGSFVRRNVASLVGERCCKKDYQNSQCYFFTGS